MKAFISKIWGSVRKTFNALRYKTRKMVPVAIDVVEGIKRVMDSPVDDVVLGILKNAIPGSADDVLIDKITKVVQDNLPRLLMNLRMVESIANIEDQNEQLKAILEQLKLSPDEHKMIIWHGIASLILQKLLDGDLSISDAFVITEFYYQNHYKK